MKIASYIKQLLVLLKELHSKNIVHLDIKPDNLLVDFKTEQIKLIGFTNAKILKPELFRNTNYENVYHDHGDPEFVAPEIVSREPITLNTDLWSVGVLTYILLSGKSPFYADDLQTTLKNVANVTWDFADTFATTSYEAKDFIQKLLLKNPKERMTVDEALNHPWIHYATHNVLSGESNRKALMEYHSKHLWSNSLKQSEPWRKLIMKSESENSADQKKIYENFEDNLRSFMDSHGRRKQLDKNDEIDEALSATDYENDGEELVPGAYLIPVKDPFFTVRMRDYRRKRYEKKIQSAKSIMPVIDVKEFSYKPIKERYHVDKYGQFSHGGSLSRTYKSSFEREHSIKSSLLKNLSTNRSFSKESSSFKQDHDELHSRTSAYGEGLAPVLREKLRDAYLIPGSTVFLRCRIDGNPTPRTVWYFNDHLLINDDDRLKFAQAENGVITLVINKARVSDIGIYRCIAINQYGKFQFEISNFSLDHFKFAY
jgi:serine/threonine protein kinase